MGQFFLAQFSKPSLRPGFQQPELGLGQLHFLADLFLALLSQVEAGQNFAVATA